MSWKNSRCKSHRSFSENMLFLGYKLSWNLLTLEAETVRQIGFVVPLFSTVMHLPTRKLCGYFNILFKMLPLTLLGSVHCKTYPVKNVQEFEIL